MPRPTRQVTAHSVDGSRDTVLVVAFEDAALELDARRCTVSRTDQNRTLKAFWKDNLIGMGVLEGSQIV